MGATLFGLLKIKINHFITVKEGRKFIFYLLGTLKLC